MIENIYNILTIVCVGLAIMSFIFLNVGDQIKKFSEVKKIKCALVVLFTMDILMVICIILGIIIRESLLNIDTIMSFISLMLLSYSMMLCRKILKDQRSIDDKAREGKNNDIYKKCYKNIGNK